MGKGESAHQASHNITWMRNIREESRVRDSTPPMIILAQRVIDTIMFIFFEATNSFSNGWSCEIGTAVVQ